MSFSERQGSMGDHLASRVEHVEKQMTTFGEQLTESIRTQGAMSAQLHAAGQSITMLSQDVKAIVNKLDGVGRLDSKTILSIISTGIAAIAVSISIVGYVGSLALDPITKAQDWQMTYFSERTKSRYTREEAAALIEKVDQNIEEDHKKHSSLSERLVRIETILSVDNK